MTEHRRFAANCPSCGDLDVVAEQMWLVLTDCPERDHYVFHCPGCGEHVRRRAHVVMVRFLERLVPVERLQIPAEAMEPREGAPLTTDDLIDLMLALDAAPSGIAPGAQPGGDVPTELPETASSLRQPEARRS